MADTHSRHRSTNAADAGSNGHTFAIRAPSGDRSATVQSATRTAPSLPRRARPAPGDETATPRTGREWERKTCTRFRHRGMLAARHRAAYRINATAIRHRSRLPGTATPSSDPRESAPSSVISQSRGGVTDARARPGAHASNEQSWWPRRLLKEACVMGAAILRVAPRPPEQQPQTPSDLARPAGFEPATRCLEGSCSVRLSYGRSKRNCARGRSRDGYMKVAVCRPLTPCHLGKRQAASPEDSPMAEGTSPCRQA